MGIGFGSGILLNLVLFADRIIAEPKSNRSILWDMEVCNDLNGVLATISTAVCSLFSKFLNTSRAPRRQIAARQLKCVCRPSPLCLNLCISRETIGFFLGVSRG